MYKDTSSAEIDALLAKSAEAYQQYKKSRLGERANFMRAIALEIAALGDELLEVAMGETNLPLARLQGERTRTIFQLNSYAEAVEAGAWLEASIDTPDHDRVPPKPDLRKMRVPLGTVAVFGASNFPFAYSTAGGDTACAFAAGCPVIVKAHPAHARTSTLVANAVVKAAEKCGMPEGVFAHIYGKNFEVGEYLAKHPNVKAIGFTGSFAGGKALFDWANQRKTPIPVFAEMGSVNPVFLLPDKLAAASHALAQQIIGSVTLGVGQFCTNPGLIIAIDDDSLAHFIGSLNKEIDGIAPARMLHQGIYHNYSNKLSEALGQKGVQVVAQSRHQLQEGEGLTSIATVTAQTFLANPKLHEEVFGPYSLIVQCTSADEMFEVAKALEGQLTATIMGTKKDLETHQRIVDVVQELCGRLILNNVPTGVEVSLSMHHGGPFPASTDSRFTSVGADGIKRFSRPLCFQNWDDEFLPDPLKNDNPLNIWRTVNNDLTRAKIEL